MAGVAKTRHALVKELPDEIIFAVAERFFVHCEGAIQIQSWLKTHREFKCSRERIYPMVREAVRRDHAILCPPVNERMNQRISDRYRKERERIHVVDVLGDSAGENVARDGADLTLDLIRKLGAKSNPVHIGLGAGHTTMRVARRIAHRLKTDDAYPDLVLHAMTSGFSVEEPQIAPVSFFSLFSESRVDVGYVGLFAPAIVNWGDYPAVKKLAGVAESFARADEIQIVITSFGSAFDDDGQFTKFMGNSQKGIDALIHAGWIGDILYLPYSPTGPITIDTDIRATTVFEFEDLGRLAHTQDGHVVLLAGPCGECKKPRTRALKPLLEEPSLEVWSHLVMDVTTANELLV